MKPFEDGWTAEDIDRAILRNDKSELELVPILVSMNPPDCAWAIDVCIRLAEHPDGNVRGNAILGLGHLARTCGSLPEERVRPGVEAALRDEHEHVRRQARNAAEDLASFLGWEFCGDEGA